MDIMSVAALVMQLSADMKGERTKCLRSGQGAITVEQIIGDDRKVLFHKDSPYSNPNAPLPTEPALSFAIDGRTINVWTQCPHWYPYKK